MKHEEGKDYTASSYHRPGASKEEGIKAKGKPKDQA
jgi:hypothetical protein